MMALILQRPLNSVWIGDYIVFNFYHHPFVFAKGNSLWNMKSNIKKAVYHCLPKL